MSDGGAQHIVWGPAWDSTNGVIYTNIWVFAFAAGTSNVKTFWTDEGKVTGVTSRQGGTTGLVDGHFDGDYKIELRKSDGTTVIDTFDNVKITSDTATMWEGNHGTAFPTVAAANIWQLFCKHTAGDVFEDLAINDGVSFKSLVTLFSLFADGGEAGGAARTLGNTDAFSLSLLTNNLAFLIADSNGIVSFQLQSQFRASGASQAIPDATWTKAQVGTELLDQQNEYDPTTNYRYTVTVGGKYHIRGVSEFQSSVDQKIYQTAIYKNGSLGSQEQLHSSGTGTISCSHSEYVVLPATEYVELFCRHDDGTSRNTMFAFFGYKQT